MAIIQGKLNEPVTLTSAVAGNWVQLEGPMVNLRIGLDQKTCSFTPSENATYKFNHGNESFEVVVGTSPTPTPTPEPTPTPTPVPEPTPGAVIYDSNVNGKWNNGVKRTVTTSEGNIASNGKGFWCAASGDPTLIIDGDGVAHLKGGSGGVDNLSLRLRSRHNMGGDCSNRFGGFGTSIDKVDNGTKTESCHNNHENSIDKPHGLNVYDNNWHHVKFECKDASTSKVLINQWIDGKQTLAASHDSPKPYYMDKALYAKESYIWIRINNSDHPRIYIAVCNYNAVMELDFKFEPANSAVALRNVKITAV